MTERTRTPLSGVVVLHGDPDELTDPYGTPSFTKVLDGLVTTRRPAQRPGAPFQWGRLPEVPYVERYPPRIDVPVQLTHVQLAEALYADGVDWAGDE